MKARILILLSLFVGLGAVYAALLFLPFDWGLDTLIGAGSLFQAEYGVRWLVWLLLMLLIAIGMKTIFNDQTHHNKPSH